MQLGLGSEPTKVVGSTGQDSGQHDICDEAHDDAYVRVRLMIRVMIRVRQNDVGDEAHDVE